MILVYHLVTWVGINWGGLLWDCFICLFNFFLTFFSYFIFCFRFVLSSFSFLNYIYKQLFMFIFLLFANDIGQCDYDRFLP